MSEDKGHRNPGGATQDNKLPPNKEPQEKTSLGGEFNSGVTSNDPQEKDEIEKKGTMAFTKNKERDEEGHSYSNTGTE